MDCKTCRNYEPIEIPDGVKTDELKVGMLLQKFHRGEPGRTFYAVAEKPGPEKVLVIHILKGWPPLEKEVYLADHGCQPYKEGNWNLANTLREITP